MHVVMTAARAWQHMGREQALSAGAAYELPDGVGEALVRSGAAVRVDPDDDDSSGPPKDVHPPETKPLTAPERKAKGRHAG